MKPIHLLLSVLFVLVLLLSNTTRSSAAVAQTSCTSSSCRWLPLVVDPSPLQFADVSSLVTGNDAILFGTVETSTSQSVYSVSLEADVFDAANHLLQTIPITHALDVVLSGQADPFYIRVTVCCQPARIEPRIRSYQLSSGRSYVTLPVTTDEWTGSHFKVSVRNDRNVSLHDVVVAVRSTGTDYSVWRFDILRPGETVLIEKDALDVFGFYFLTWGQAYLET